MRYPFREEKRGNKRLRTFAENVDSSEMVWHRDREDRIVTVLESCGWYFQFDDKLPMELREGDELRIPAGVWHRIAKIGKGSLVVEIERL